MKIIQIYVMVGVFLGNWVVIPFLFSKWSYERGFWVGLTASILVAVLFSDNAKIKLIKSLRAGRCKNNYTRSNN